MSFTGTAEYCAFYSAGIFVPTFSKYVLYYHMLSHFMPSLSLFFFNYFRLLRRTHSTDSFPPFRSMCSYKFYLQINVHKVGIKATVNVQNKNNNSFNSFVHRLVFQSRSRPRNLVIVSLLRS